MKSPTLESALAHERLIVVIALALIVIVSTLAMIRSGDALMIDHAGPRGIAYGVLLFLMWWTMMMAMMLPSAAPAILTFAAINARLDARAKRSTGEFALGYAAVWTFFSLAAVVVHLAFESLVPFTGMMAVTSRGVGGALLIAAGIYQLTPLKGACLTKCQAPLFFLARNWRKGRLAGLRMGFHHGVYCLGCCWVLMAVLFYGGVMELSWILGIALYVLAEKVTPRHWPLRHLSGLILIAWGLIILAAVLFPVA